MKGESLTFEAEEQIETNFDRIGLAIAAFESSAEINSFSSKFDCYLKGMTELTLEEAFGLELFNSEEKGKSALCHISDGPAPLIYRFHI